MPIVTFSEAFPRGRGGRRGRKGGRQDGSGGRGRGDGRGSAGAQEGQKPFQGRGQSLANAASVPPPPDGTGVYAPDQRPVLRPSFQDAIQAWQAKHDDAALLALADRLVEEHHQQSAAAEQAVRRKEDGEEAINLCDSDDDALPQQPAGRHAPLHKAQTAAKDAEAKRRKGEAATQAYGLAPPASEASNRKVQDLAKHSSSTAASGSEASRRKAAEVAKQPDSGAQHSQSAAAQGLEASGRRAAVPAKQAQRIETRQLGIRDPPPPQLSGSNALLKSLAQGANRAKQASKSNSDWMFGGDGAYAPNPSSAVDMKLRLHEIVNVFDIGVVPQPARALLDSGNGGCTLITRSFAARLQLVDENGRPRQSSCRQTTVQGVVAGASERIFLMNLSYELRGKKMHITAGVTEARLGCDLLLSCQEIGQFISDGFIFDIR